MTGWTPALRIARRELRRAPGRTLLVLAMVLLPVTAVSAGSTLLRTAEVSVVEGLPETLGSATARLDVGTSRVDQDPVAQFQAQYENVRPAEESDIRALLPDDAQLLAVLQGSFDSARLQVGERRIRATPVVVDLGDAEARGPFTIADGRAPAAPGEVAVAPELADGGADVGATVELDGAPRTVTGVVEAPDDVGYGGAVFALPGELDLELAQAPLTRYWVSGPDVTWDDVRALNAIGVTVLSRSVVLDPPPDDQVATGFFADDNREVTLAIVGLIAVMAVLEVVLLAGPAFAVGARRQRRSLALMAAGGAEPLHVRRVVLAQGLLVGVVAAGVGVPLGVAIAALARAPLTRYADATWGPFDVAPLDLLLVAGLGAGTALLAALLPAAVMARQPVVAALTGRRVTSAGAARPALLGLVLLGVGLLITLTALGGRSPFGYAELGVAVGAIPTVLGAVLLAPATLALVGRLAGRLPLPLRFAVRDADRQRGRTAPAVAAIAATVAGVVALGVASSSDAAQNRRDYRPSGPPGAAVVAGYGADVDLAAAAQAARQALPGEPVREVPGLPPPVSDPAGYTEVQLCRASERPVDGRCFDLTVEHSAGYGSDLLVGAAGLRLLEPQLGPGAVVAGGRALAQGRVLLPVSGLEAGAPLELRLTRFTLDQEAGEVSEVLATVPVTASELPVPMTGPAPVRAVLPERIADQLGGAQTVALLVGDDLSRAQEQALGDAVAPVDEALSVRVERGYEGTGDRTVLLVLMLVVAVLVLAGTLAATALALSEARPDLVTLGQVGARPRTRRAVAAGYALVLGAVGAVLGTAAGMVPGIAAAVPLTRDYSSSTLSPGVTGVVETDAGFVIDIPWTLLVVVLVVLPLVSAAVSALAARGPRPDPPRRAVA